MDLEQVLQKLTELAERQAAGENVAAEKAKLEEEKKRLQREEDEAATKAAEAEKKNSGETELDRLRRQERERLENELVQSAVKRALEISSKNSEDQRNRMTAIATEAVSKALGGGDIDAHVRDLLASTRTESRFIGHGGDEDVAKAIANGTGTAVERNAAGTTQVGVSKGAVAIKDRKSLAEFMSIVARASRPSLGMLKPEEKEFLEWSQKAALAEGTTTAGGYLIHPEWMPDILGLLRGWAIVRQANPRIVPFSRLMNQTSISTGATAFYTAENAAISPSGMTFNEAPLLTPHNLTALVPVSNYLLNDAASAESIVRDDLAVVMGLREDLAFLQGTGTGGEPLGLRNIASVTLNPLTVATNGISLNLVNMRQIKNTVRSMNAVGARWAWFFNPAMVSHLETLTDSFGRFLADTSILTYDEPNHSGTLDGIPFFTSNQIPINLTTGSSTNTTYLMLVNMAETIVGASQDLSLDVSSEASYTSDGGTTWVSTFQNNQTLFRAVMRHDINHRRPNQIIIQTGVIVP